MRQGYRGSAGCDAKKNIPLFQADQGFQHFPGDLFSMHVNQRSVDIEENDLYILHGLIHLHKPFWKDFPRAQIRYMVLHDSW